MAAATRSRSRRRPHSFAWATPDESESTCAAMPTNGGARHRPKAVCRQKAVLAPRLLSFGRIPGADARD